MYLNERAGMPEAEAKRHALGLLALTGRGALALADNWWMFLLRGILALLFGVLALLQPVPALAALVLVFGVWAFIDGITALVLAVTGWRSWQLALAGLVGIGAGVLTFYRPELTALGLYGAFAGWSIARGILELAVAIELRKQIRDEAWLIVGGISSILFGALLIALPAVGVLAVAWLIGVYALFFGAIMTALSLRLRRLRKPAERLPTMAAPTPA